MHRTISTKLEHPRGESQDTTPIANSVRSPEESSSGQREKHNKKSGDMAADSADCFTVRDPCVKRFLGAVVRRH